MKKLIAELGLCFPPSSKVDEEGRAAQLAYLANDVADVPVSLLARACKKWREAKLFLPKAVELVALAADIARADQGRYRMDGETLEQRRNYDILFRPDEPGKPEINCNCHWSAQGVVEDGAPTRADCFPAREWPKF